MNVLRRGFLVAMAAFTIALALPTVSFAQAGRWVNERYGHYFTREEAAGVAADIQRSGAPDLRNPTYEQTPHPVTRTFAVYVERFHPDQTPASSVSGSITKGDPMDRVKTGSHHKVYTLQMAPGRTYTIDLTSPRGPSFFDTYLRIEDSRGNQVAFDDDSGGNLNSRIVFNPSRADNYRLIVTTYQSGATGSFTLTIR